MQSSSRLLSRSNPALGLSKLYMPARNFSTARVLLNSAGSRGSGGVPASTSDTGFGRDVRFVEGSETLFEVRKDLAALLQEELETKCTPAMREEHAEETFLFETKASVTEDGNKLKVAWRVDPYSIEAEYEKPSEPVNATEDGLGMDIVTDLDGDQLKELGDEDQAGVDNEEDIDDEEDEPRPSEEDEEEEDEPVMFEVKLKKDGVSKPVSLVCVAGDDSRLYVDQLQSGEQPPVNFDTLPESVRDRFYDFLDLLKVDDIFSNYMRRQYYKAKRVVTKDTLEAWLEYVTPAENEIEKKEKKGSKKGQKKH